MLNKGIKLQSEDIIKFGKVKFRIKGIQTLDKKMFSQNIVNSTDIINKTDCLISNFKIQNREVKISFYSK